MASAECGAHKALRPCTFGEKHTVLRVGGAERAPDQTCKKQTRRTYGFPFRVPSRVSRANPPSWSPTAHHYLGQRADVPRRTRRRRSIGLQVVFHANYLQLTVLSSKTQDPCLIWLRWCNSGL